MDDIFAQPDTSPLPCEAVQQPNAPRTPVVGERPFSQQYAKWLADQRRLVGDHGLWNADIAVW